MLLWGPPTRWWRKGIFAIYLDCYFSRNVSHVREHPDKVACKFRRVSSPSPPTDPPTRAECARRARKPRGEAREVEEGWKQRRGRKREHTGGDPTTTFRLTFPTPALFIHLLFVDQAHTSGFCAPHARSARVRRVVRGSADDSRGFLHATRRRARGLACRKNGSRNPIPRLPCPSCGPATIRGMLSRGTQSNVFTRGRANNSGRGARKRNVSHLAVISKILVHVSTPRSCSAAPRRLAPRAHCANGPHAHDLSFQCASIRVKMDSRNET